MHIIYIYLCVCVCINAGHTSGVGCVAFDAHEEAVVAGAASGTLKLWDLNQARALTHAHALAHAHARTRTRTHAHTHGSQCGTLKLWDLRQAPALILCMHAELAHVTIL